MQRFQDCGLACAHFHAEPVTQLHRPQGRIIQNATGASNRIAPERCARLIAAAMAHGLDEAWIARHPVLAVGELALV